MDTMTPNRSSNVRFHHRLAIAVVVLLTIVGAAVLAAHASGVTIQKPAETPHSVPRSDSGSVVAVDTATTIDDPILATEPGYLLWVVQQESDRQAAVAALSAAQAQALADQLQAAINRSLTAVPAPQATPVVTSQPSGEAPCIAPNVALAWIAWCESGCNPTNHNPSSSAAGKYQYLFTTWNDFGGYASADVAPEYVQDQRAAQDTAGGNYSPWNSSRGCWGGKF